MSPFLLPGGPAASVVALNPATGEVVWSTSGGKAAFSSFIVRVFGGRRQLVGYDKDSLGGYDIASGERLWRLVPTARYDFNVPTPIAVDGRLLVSTENNGTRLYEFDAHGRIVPAPIAVNEDLAPDAHTPVVLGSRVFGVNGAFLCLDAGDGLRELWRGEDAAFDDYAVAIGAGDRVLVQSIDGELLLIDAAADEYRVISRAAIFHDDPGVYSHPALVGTRLYMRGSDEVLCLELSLR